MQAFCNRFKLLREEKQISALALSKELNVHHSTVIRWERGEVVPSIDHLYNIATYFGVSADYLIGLEE